MTTTNATTPIMSRTSVPIVVGLWNTRKRILSQHSRKESQDFRQQSKLVQPKRWHVKPRMRSWMRPIQASILHVPWKRHQPSHQRLSSIHQIQKKDRARLQPVSTTIHIYRGKPHRAMGTTSPPILPFLLFPLSNIKPPNQ
jgi:hypothetical protein